MSLHCVSLVMNETQPTLDTLEAHRKFIGMPQSILCEALEIQLSTYFRWRKNGTTPYNVSRVHDAIRKFAKQHSLQQP